MTDVFEKLKSLQDILSRKFEIENELSEIPKALETKKELLSRLKVGYIEKNDRLNAIKTNIRKLQLDMAAVEEKRESLEKQMDLIKTQREYEALDKEIQDAGDKEQTLRKDIQRESKVLEELSKSIEREELLIHQQEGELDEEKQRILEESKGKEDELENLKDEEQEIVPGMDSEIIFKFERIIRNKSGLGIVPIKKGTCSGCHMLLPAQFVNDVRGGEGILFCPYCSRILHWEQSVADEEVMIEGISEEDAGGLADLLEDDDD
ncbi:zinc ribbon domain-containing protein [Spirochaeta cellobiosiphila]|uniref:zinc ribbon domain-containing protein n=1 Tax=Spirochaeta cellobiosiphila TaxID=504483 RepID=UPI0004294793|nr:zinc ribbon domain-containing protein [Spirochaeta cellobiosiphila]